MSALNNVSNVNTMNGPATRRKSLAPGKDVRRRRSSVAPNHGEGGEEGGGGRRQSIGGGRRMSMGGGAASVRPARNLTDKSVMQDNMRKLLFFLEAHGYPEQLSLKQVTAPTTKVFLGILQFLAERVMPGFALSGGAKQGHQITALFKALKYPITVPASAVQSVAAPHTWGSLLGALVWLTELISYEEQVLERHFGEDGKFSQSQSDEKAFFQYLASGYQLFMSDDPRLEQMERDVASTFRERCVQLKEEIAALEAECKAKSAQVERAQSEPTPLERATAARDDLLADRAKFRDYMEKLQQVCETCKARIAEEEEEIGGMGKEIEALHAERERLAAELAAQDISPEDVERLTKTRTNLDSALKSLVSQKEGLQQSIWEQETRASKQLDEVEECVQAYNKLGTETRLIPASAKYAAGKDFELAFNINGQTVEEMLGADIKKVLKPAFLELKDSLMAKYREKQEAATELREKADLADEALADKRDDVQTLEAQLQKMELEMQEAKRSGDEEIKGRAQEAEALVSGAVKMRQELQQNLTTSVKSLELVQQEAEELARALERERNAAHNLLVDTLAMLMDHKQFVSQELAALEKTVSSIALSSNATATSMSMSNFNN